MMRYACIRYRHFEIYTKKNTAKNTGFIASHKNHEKQRVMTRLPAQVYLMMLDMTPSLHSFVFKSNSPYISPRDRAFGFRGNS